METKSSKIYSIVLIGVFTAIISIISALPIGFNILGVPATLQTFAMAFIGFLLGYKKGTLCVFIYILLGVIGIPVFNGFNGGLSVLLGVTGGFIIGFLFLAFFSGLGMKFKKPANPIVLAIIRILLSIVGLLICHLIGSIAGGIYLEKSTFVTATIISFPYLPKDILSVVLAYFIALAVRKALKAAKLGFVLD